VATSVVASKGIRHTPRLLAAIDGEPVEAPLLEPIVVPDEYWDAIYEGMIEVVHGQ
jgi:penicillin-binding protein 2